MINKFAFGKFETSEGVFKTNIKVIEGICQEWCPEDHHHIKISDIKKDVEEQKPEIVIFGNGVLGVSQMMSETKQFLEDKNTELIELNSGDASKKINKLIEEKKSFIGFLHHTC